MYGEEANEQRCFGGENRGKETIWRIWEQMGILKSILKKWDGKE
jgi:hypothetical protein